MKNLFLTLFILSFITIKAQSRGTRIGAQAGIGETWFSNSLNGKSFSGVNATPKLFFTAGLGASHQFTRWFGLNGSVLLASKGQSFEGTEQGEKDLFGNTPSYKYEETYRLLYTEIPLLAKVSIGFDNFFIKAFAGPSIGFNLHSSDQKIYNDQRYNDENGYNKTIHPSQVTELSAIAGFGIEAERKNEEIVFLDVRVNNALNNWGKVNGQNAFNNYFSVNVGYLMK
jgi:hypothetical protein